MSDLPKGVCLIHGEVLTRVRKERHGTELRFYVCWSCQLEHRADATYLWMSLGEIQEAWRWWRAKNGNGTVDKISFLEPLACATCGSPLVRHQYLGETLVCGSDWTHTGLLDWSMETVAKLTFDPRTVGPGKRPKNWAEYRIWRQSLPKAVRITHGIYSLTGHEGRWWHAIDLNGVRPWDTEAELLISKRQRLQGCVLAVYHDQLWWFYPEPEEEETQ